MPVFTEGHNLKSNLHFVDDEVNGGVLTVIYKKQFTRVWRLTKDRVRSTAESNIQHSVYKSNQVNFQQTSVEILRNFT